jgi:hypothetical protein
MLRLDLRPFHNADFKIKRKWYIPSKSVPSKGKTLGARLRVMLKRIWFLFTIYCLAVSVVPRRGANKNIYPVRLLISTLLQDFRSYSATSWYESEYATKCIRVDVQVLTKRPHAIMKFFSWKRCYKVRLIPRVFSRLRKIAKSDYYLRHVCLSVHRHENNSAPTGTDSHKTWQLSKVFP